MEKRVVVVIEGRDLLSGPARNAGSALIDIGKIAIGGALAAGLTNIASGFANIGREAIDTVAKNELLGKSLTTMLSREIVKQGVQTKSVQVGTLVTQLTQKQSAANADLALKITTTKNAIAVENEHLAEAIKRGKDSAAELDKRRIRISNLTAQLAKYNAETTKNSSGAGKTVGVYKTLTTQTVSLAEAQKLAAQQSKELLEWMEKQAIYSPYTMDQVSAQFKMAMAYGFTSDEAKRLTNANIDLAAALGMEGSTMERVNLALGQMRSKGRLMGQELLQMTEAGIPMRDILLEMGTVAGLTAGNFDKMMEAGEISAKGVYEAYAQYSEKYFRGTARDQSSTIAGLLSSLGDLKKVAEKDFFTPALTRVQPFLSSLVDIAQNGEVRTFIKTLGEGFGKLIMVPFKPAEDFLKNVQANLSLGRDLKTSLRIAFDMTFPEVSTLAKEISAGVERISDKIKLEQSKGKSPIKIGIEIALDIGGGLVNEIDRIAKEFSNSGEAKKLGVEVGKFLGSVVGDAVSDVFSASKNGENLPGSYGIKIGQEFGKGFREGIENSLKDINFDRILTDWLNGLSAQVKKIGDGLHEDTLARDGSFGDSIIGRLLRGLPLFPENNKNTTLPPVPTGAEWEKWQQDYLSSLPSPDSWSPEEFAALEKGTTSVGKALSNGMTKGAEGDKGLALGAAFTSTIQSGIEAAKAYADIKSPSGLTEEEIGSPLALGVQVGIAREAGVVIDQAMSLANGVVGGLLQVFSERKAEVVNSLLAMVSDAVAAIKIQLGIGDGAAGVAPNAQGASYSVNQSASSYIGGVAAYSSASASARPTHERVPVQVDGRPLFYLFVDWMNREIHSEELRYG